MPKDVEDREWIESAKKGCQWQESAEIDSTRIETYAVGLTGPIKECKCARRPIRADSGSNTKWNLEDHGEHRKVKPPVLKSDDSDIFRHSVLLQGSVVAETEQLAALRTFKSNRTAEPIVEILTVPLRPPSCHEYEMSSPGDALAHRSASDSIGYLRFFVQPEHPVPDLGGNLATEVENDAFHPTSPLGGYDGREVYQAGEARSVSDDKQLSGMSHVQSEKQRSRPLQARHELQVECS
ncbi:hypothetical protein CONPUDRAFT_138088 [Coniophora puteana RWD-64-598 SS2]|uniref:Uncharacterized protein n=1 Tax=Coniophora puteana (strain RWD-64-598) TaxID=741705 RepID=A0A5M3MMZ0_CONPW|nr:uncharacterized protein CONPUDRAFT_138088 [Coniophora puteana RWD-64-598 SS2]EIW79971.1 hypothetical protein CONPUDRAFT_138088 [Coniophora puteana RWD-64-598 SS2]